MTVVCGSYEIHTALTEKFLGYRLFLLVFRIIDGDGVSAEHADDLHARNVGLSVSHIYHLRERNPLLVLCHTLIDLLGVPRTEDTFIYLEYELCLGGVVHSDARPLGLSLGVIQERARENVLELLGERTALDDLLETGGVDVVLHLYALAASIFIDKIKPALEPLEKLYVLSEFLELAALEPDALGSRLVEHQLHVGEDVARVLSGSDAVAYVPELFRRLADGLDESEFLHIARGQCPVKVVDESDYRFSCHSQCATAEKNEQQSRPPLANIVKSYYICAIYDGQASGFFVTET